MKLKSKIAYITRILLTTIVCFIQGLGINLTYANSNWGYNQTVSNKVQQDIVFTVGDLEAFSDEFFNQYMKQYQIPGGAVVIVQGNKILFEKGYGYSNLEEKVAFDVEKTSFSIASITKTFTAIAMMKLVEEGKIDLDKDILTYIPTLKMDNPYKEKVTVRQLLTHTSGIDSSYTEDLSYEEIDNNEPHYLLDLLNKRGIKVVSRPGQFVEYSSYGTVVLGAIVEEVGGISCASYIEQNILKPLNMQQTKLLSPDYNRTKGYRYNGKCITEAELIGYFKMYPEGGLVSTIEDMAHYIQMLLGEGSYEGNIILDTALLKQMFMTQASFDEVLPGMGYGFAEYMSQGVRAIGHAGYSIDGTLSEVVIYPQYNIGTFIVVNQGSNNNIQEEFRKAFISRYLKNEDLIDKKFASEEENEEHIVKAHKNVTGIYRFSDYSKSNIHKGNTFGMGEIKVEQIDDTTILMSGNDDFTFEPYKKEAVYIGDLTYKVNDEEEVIVFREDRQGNIAYMANTATSNHGIYEKLKWYEEARWQVPFFVAALGIYIIQLVVSFFIYIRRKIKKKKRSSKGYTGKLINSIAFLNITFFIYSMCFWGDRLRYFVPMDIYINLMMPNISVILTFILGGALIKDIYKSIYKRQESNQKPIYRRLYEIGMLLLSILFVLFLNYWNFIGFRF